MLLVTGVTGFLGTAFYLQAVREGRAAECLLLVRGASEEACRDRLAHALARQADAAEASFASRQCGSLSGDLQSLSGLSDPRLEAVTHIAHLAADTSFDERASIWQTNVEGTACLATRAQGMR